VHHVHELGRLWQGAAQDAVRHQGGRLQAAHVGHVLPAEPHWLQRADQHVRARVVCRLLVVRYQRQQRPHVLQHRTGAVRFLLQRNEKGEQQLCICPAPCLPVIRRLVHLNYDFNFVFTLLICLYNLVHYGWQKLNI